MILTRQQLLLDLYQAFYSAQRHKSKRSYVMKWQRNLKQNMESLCDDLYYRRYKPMPSKCFIVEYPKKREIFAAVFRDRIVHHLYFNYTHQLFERTFIQDSYSCIKGRGTHYGIRRITDMCRKESQNWQRRCYALHLDIRGYFMHIDRKRLLKITTALLRNMASHHLSKTDHRTWDDVLDMDFLTWLTGVIIMLDPKENCIIVGNPSAWDDLDPSKSLLHLPPGIGLPIGNLTSQLFSNVYLNTFDQYMKRVKKCKRYGRYVDDAIVVSTNKQWLISLIPAVRQFLQERQTRTIRSPSWCGVPRCIYQAIPHLRGASCRETNAKEDSGVRLYEAVGGSQECEQLPWHLPSYSHLQPAQPTVDE